MTIFVLFILVKAETNKLDLSYLINGDNSTILSASFQSLNNSDLIFIQNYLNLIGIDLSNNNFDKIENIFANLSDLEWINLNSNEIRFIDLKGPVKLKKLYLLIIINTSTK